MNRKKYRFNLLDEQLEDINRQSIQDRPGTSGLRGSGGVGGKKRKLYLEPPLLQNVVDDDGNDDYDEQEEKEPTQKVRKAPPPPPPPPAAASTTVTRGNDNDDNDDDDDDTLLLSQNIFQNKKVISPQADSNMFFASPVKWIFYKHNDTNVSFDNLNILLDSDVTVCTLQKNQTISIEKIYKMHKRCSINVETIGYWTLSGGLVEYGIEKNVLRRRGNLMGTTLDSCIVITNNDSLNHLTDKRYENVFIYTTEQGAFHER
ncbi:unnamed protein product [Acanthoscelides obtectus]|uniref:Ionotropic receptor 75a N-terminal domain-containing protein n=1 Tax=Acanthoscelides obtectus TaxID=200917 RepID=A0A9P0L2W9_ACAOB|nr:unnamed protein product [Acanthoscelides obtectus]CAK1671081.1 hypothetical protein AOBTE_LOCUS28045 [Acanthoscelides obtectus]